MGFSEALELKTLRSKIVDILEYVDNWEEYDPCCPKEDDVKISLLRMDIDVLLEQVEEKMEELGKTNKDCYEY